MAEAVETASNFPLNLGAFNRLPTRIKLAAMVGISVAVAAIVGTWLWAKQPDYTVLFSNLNDRDGGEIVTSLQQQNVPYRFSDTGGAILVPAAQVHDIRLKLASQGLPKGGMVGFEVLENQKLGASQFLEQVNYQRALEGELARTISTISSVKGARVHLAMPKQSAFLRDEQKPTASVLVNLQPGRSLDGVQIAGIVHLVSASVPDLNAAAVSVVDQEGNLISQQADPSRTAGLDPTQVKYVRDLETDYGKRIEAILTPIVGAGNVKAQVTADLDFSQVDQVAESFKPNPTTDAAIRSQQINEAGSGTPPAAGVPGALTNQPPVPATAPLTAPAANGAAANSAAANQNYTRNSTVNFEVDKTIRHTKVAPGSIRRLSVAVLVNQKPGNGKAKSVPLTADEVKQITAMAREAVGFNQERGDTLNVTNAAFTPEDPNALPQTPIYKDPTIIAILKDLSRYAIFLIIAWMTWTKLLQPLFRKLQEMMRPPEPLPGEEEEMEEERHHHAHGFDHKMEQARALAKSDPKAVANVIKEWVGGSEPR